MMDFLCSWIRTNMAKAMLLKAAYRFSTIPIKIPKTFTTWKMNPNSLACSWFSPSLSIPPTHTHAAFFSWISSLTLIFSFMVVINTYYGLYLKFLSQAPVLNACCIWWDYTGNFFCRTYWEAILYLEHFPCSFHVSSLLSVNPLTYMPKLQWTRMLPNTFTLQWAETMS